MLDRRKVWKSAERLLKQGKTQAALDELKKVSEKSEGDVVVLNRLADLLAQLGKSSEAIAYYSKIATRFEEGGFVPKAIAIHTKILRLAPDWSASLIQLGELYSRQNLHGEARRFLLHAANSFVKENELDKARRLFEKLVDGEPDNFLHSLRLAETVAAAGENERAIELLLHAGEQALIGDDAANATKIFTRAAELGCHSPRLTIGRARCHEAFGETEAAQRLLQPCVGMEGGGAAAVELARLYLIEGDCSRATPLMRKLSVLDAEPSQWVRLMKAALVAQAAGSSWVELDAAIARAGGYAESRVLRLLDALAEVEELGHVPALKRLADAYQSRGELSRAVPAFDALVRACRAQSLEDEAQAALRRMQSLAPADEEPRAPARSAVTRIEPTSLTDDTLGPSRPVAVGAIDMSSLAVPRNPADEEFCAGRLTQAEVLEKYDLSTQALEQLDEILARFPGHVEAHSQRVTILRDLGSKSELAQGLAQMAMAQQAAGRIDSARATAEEALASSSLSPATRAKLVELDLAEAEEATAALPLAPSECAGPTAVEQTAFEQPAVEPPPVQSRSQATSAAEDASEILIDLDMDGDFEEDTVERRPTPSGPPIPSADLLNEVRDRLRSGDLGEARLRLDALCEQGYAGPEMGRLRRELEESRVEEESAADEADANLMAIHAALEGEMLGDIDMAPIVPEEPDEDVGQILDAFRRRVDEEVGADDHRTHYDLGIGFKEMGLLDEAISEFERSIKGPTLHVESATMLALCHRELQAWGEAERWYRSAVSEAVESGECARLQYDLAEVLLLAGDTEGALVEFRNLLNSQPAYRDVESRVSALEVQLQS